MARVLGQYTKYKKTVRTAGHRHNTTQPARTAGHRQNTTQPAPTAGHRQNMTQPARTTGHRQNTTQPARTAGQRQNETQSSGRPTEKTKPTKSDRNKLSFKHSSKTSINNTSTQTYLGETSANHNDDRFHNAVASYNRSHKGQTLNKWKENDMKSALLEWSAGEKSIRKLSRAWNVPLATLFRRIKRQSPNWMHSSGRNTVLSAEQEAELVKLITTLSQRGFPLTRKDIQRIAYQFAEKNGISGFSKNKQSAGRFWFQGFMRRHENLSSRKPENLSAARAAGMNKTVVRSWFDTYAQLVDELELGDKPDRIWNCDESGVNDQFDQGRVVAEVGQPCYRITPGEKGTTTTLLAAFNAAGEFGPPMVIFKGKKIKPEWCIGSPPDTIIKCSDNGWITTDLLLQWSKQFIHQFAVDGLPRILLLDGHVTHTYNLEFLELMKQNLIEVFCFPSHTTHWLQAADKSFFRSFKSHWNGYGREYVRQSAGSHLPRNQFFKIFTRAWNDSTSQEVASSGFRATGTWPVSFGAIPDMAFHPSLTTERPLLSENNDASPRGKQQTGEIVVQQPGAIVVQQQVEILVQQQGEITVQQQEEIEVQQEEEIVVQQQADIVVQQQGEIEVQQQEDIVVQQEEDIVVQQQADIVVQQQEEIVVQQQGEIVVQQQEEIVVQQQEEIPVSKACCSFFDILPIPTRDRQGKRQRKKLPTHHLTSMEHIEYIRAAIEKKGKMKYHHAPMSEEHISKKRKCKTTVGGTQEKAKRRCKSKQDSTTDSLEVTATSSKGKRKQSNSDHQQPVQPRKKKIQPGRFIALSFYNPNVYLTKKNINILCYI